MISKDNKPFLHCHFDLFIEKVVTYDQIPIIGET